MIKFTRSNIRTMNSEILEVLEKYGFKNVEFSMGGTRFSENEATMKLTAKIAGTATRKESDLARYCKIDGIDMNGRGPKGEKLVEYHTRKPKFPYIYVTVRGTRYKCSAIAALNKFGHKFA